MIGSWSPYATTGTESGSRRNASSSAGATTSTNCSSTNGANSIPRMRGCVVLTTRSSSDVSRPARSSGVSPNRTRTSRSVPAHSRSRGSTTVERNSAGPPRNTVCSVAPAPVASATASTAASIAPPMRARRARPRLVGVTPRDVRSKTRYPSSRSSACSCAETVDWVRPSSSAPPVTEPARATATNAASASSDVLLVGGMS